MEYDYRKVMDFIDGSSKEEDGTAIYKFIKAFKTGDVERALEIFEQGNLDEAWLVKRGIGAHSADIKCPLLLALILQTFNDDKKQIEILTKIIKNPRNKSVNYRWSIQYLNPIENSYSFGLKLAIKHSLSDVIKAFCERSDVDLQYKDVGIGGYHKYYQPFIDAVDKAREGGDLQPLVILLNSGKVYMTSPVFDWGEKTHLEYLKEEKDKISKTIAKKLKRYELDAEKIASLKELEKKAEAAKTVEKPVEPKKRLFGKKKYEAEMEEYNKQYREYWHAQRDIREYNELKKEVDEQQRVYDEKREEFEGLFRVIDDATKEPLKVSSKPREV